MPTIFNYKNAILESLKRWGKSDREALKDRVCARLNIEDKDYNDKTFYRHMQQLVDELLVDYCEDEVSKRKSWFLHGGETLNIANIGSITENNGFFYCPKILQDDVRLTPGAQSLDRRDEVQLYFNINHSFICLVVDRGAIPFKLHIARKVDAHPNGIISKVSEKHGMRTMILHLPIPSLSSLKECGDSGHIVLGFSEKGCELQDLKSSNGTIIKKIGMDEAEKMVKTGDMLGKNTVSGGWDNHALDLVVIAHLKDRNNILLQSSFLTMLGGDFPLMCVWHKEE